MKLKVKRKKFKNYAVICLVENNSYKSSLFVLFFLIILKIIQKNNQ